MQKEQVETPLKNNQITRSLSLAYTAFHSPSKKQERVTPKKGETKSSWTGRCQAHLGTKMGVLWWKQETQVQVQILNVESWRPPWCLPTQFSEGWKPLTSWRSEEPSLESWTSPREKTLKYWLQRFWWNQPAKSPYSEKKKQLTELKLLIRYQCPSL